MKKLFTFLLFTLSINLVAQEEIAVGLHYVTVNTDDEAKLIDLEKEIFSKLHKYSIDAGKKIAWDIWRLENDTDPMHTTFVYAHLQPSLDQQDWGWDNQTIFSKSELALAQEKWWSLVVSQKTIMTTYKGGFAPINEKPVEFSQLSFMNVDPTSHYDYEQMELKNFMPAHKANKLVKGWALHRIVNPHPESENDYLTANFFDSMEDIYKNTNNVAKLTKQQKADYGEILKLRSMTKVEIFKLMLSVR
jgi:hypothetical protein